MDKTVQGQYVLFLKSAAGQDLIDRLKSTEANYMMQGMKSSTLEGKGISMAKMEAIYSIRTMLDDLGTPSVVSKVASSQSNRSAGSK